MAIQTEERLGRNLGFFPVFAIGTGTMIGAGIFVLPGIASANAGPAAAISFFLGGLISLATAMSMAELATGMPRAGGTYYFISRSMGAYFGTIIGMGAWLALIFKGSFALVGLAEYLQQLVPVPILIAAIVSGLLLLFLNYRGAENSGKLQNYIVIGLFIILAGYITRGAFMVEREYLEPFIPYGPASIFATTGIIFVSFLGITQLAALSEEVKNPSKNLPRAFIASVGAVTLLYVGVMLVTNGTLPLNELVELPTPLVSAGTMMAGTPGRLAIILAGFFATVSTANAAIISSSRFPFAMSRDNLVPQWFVDIHDEFSTPYKSILVTGGVMLTLVLLFDVEGLARLGSTFNVMVFVLVNVSVVILRNTELDWYEPTFHDPFYPVTQIFGVLGSLMLLPQLGTAPLAFAIAVIALGSVWYLTYASKKARPTYNILDMLEDDIPTSPEEQETVLVAVDQPDYEQDLLQLGASLGDKVVGLNVLKVPPQTGLQAARENYRSHEKRQQDLLKEGIEQSWVAHKDKEYRYLTVFDHSVPGAINEQAENESADLIVLGWQRRERLQKIAGGVTNTILRSARHNVAVLKGHFPEELETITVPYGGGTNARYSLYIAKRLAVALDAELEIFRVVNPDLQEEEKAQIRNELEELTQNISECRVRYTIEERFSVTDAVMDAAETTDLLVMGDSNERLKRAYLGRITMRVARHSDGPVLVVRRFRPLSLLGLLARLESVENTEGTAPTVEERANNDEEQADSEQRTTA